MTHSPTPTELLALRTANAALMSPDSSYDFASTIVFALGSAQLLQSPETAAELARLRTQASPLPVDDERLADIASRRLEAVEVSALACWPLVEYRLIQQALKDSAVLLAEVGRLRAQLAELETQRPTPAPVLTELPDVLAGPPAAVLGRALLVEDPHDSPLHHDYRLGHDLLDCCNRAIGHTDGYLTNCNRHVGHDGACSVTADAATTSEVPSA